MLKRLSSSHLLRVCAGKNLWRTAFRTCQTEKFCTDDIPKETDSVKAEKEDDPDMFISDIDNPFEKKKHICIICKYNIPLDYRNPRLLSQFVSPYTGFLYDRHITGLCDAQQKRIVIAIKRSQDSGFMAYRIKVPKYLKDPKLFDPFSPSRPNPF